MRGQTPLRAVPDRRNYELCSSSLSSLLSVVPRLRATRKRDEWNAPQPLETAISLTDGAAASQAEIGSFYNSSSPRAGTHAGTSSESIWCVADAGPPRSGGPPIWCATAYAPPHRGRPRSARTRNSAYHQQLPTFLYPPASRGRKWNWNLQIPLLGNTVNYVGQS